MDAEGKKTRYGLQFRQDLKVQEYHMISFSSSVAYKRRTLSKPYFFVVSFVTVSLWNGALSPSSRTRMIMHFISSTTFVMPLISTVIRVVSRDKIFTILILP